MKSQPHHTAARCYQPLTTLTTAIATSTAFVAAGISCMLLTSPPALAQKTPQTLSQNDLPERFTHRFNRFSPAHNQQAPINNTLPLRNLRVEVRQTGSTATANTNYGANARIILQPGNSRGNIGLHGSDNTGKNSKQSAQQALVLNGRRVRFTTGNTQALRVIQTVYTRHNGVAIAPSTVFIQRNTGFYARPEWYGGQNAEVEITAMLDRSDPYRVRKLEKETATASTTVSLPLHQWVTIAEAHDTQADQQSGTLHSNRRQHTDSMKIQMRITPQ